MGKLGWLTNPTWICWTDHWNGLFIFPFGFLNSSISIVFFFFTVYKLLNNFFHYPCCLIGGSQSWFPARHEAGGCRFNGATAGVCSHGDEDCAPVTEDPLWRLGGWIRPVGGLRVTWPLPCGLVSADGLPAPTPRLPE